MRLNRSNIVFVFLSFLTFGCGQEVALDDSAGVTPVVEALISSQESMSRTSVTAGTSSTAPRHIIRNGRLRWQTNDWKKTHADISRNVEHLGGFVGNDQQYRSDGYFEQTLVVRIPSDRFEQFVSQIGRNVDRFDVREFDAQDVTEDFIDLEARLAVKQDIESRYRELLTRAESVEDVLKVERELGSIRTDIESVEGRLKYLRDQIAFSTLQISYYEKDAAVTGFWARTVDNFSLGWKGLVEFALAVVVVWPFLLFVLVLCWVVRRLVRSKCRIPAAAD